MMMSWIFTWVVLAAVVAIAIWGVVSRVKQAQLGKFTVPLTQPQRARDLISWPLFAANVLITAAVNGALVFAKWQPQTVPLHWNLQGKVDRWGDPHTLWKFDVTMLVALLLPLATVWMVSRVRWALPQGESERALPLQIRQRQLLMHFTQAVTLAGNLWLAFQWLAIVKGWEALVVPTSQLTLLSESVIIIGFCVSLARVQKELSALGAEPGLGTQTSGWRWKGVVYYAPNDAALFVPKRVGIGVTINMARPLAWLFLGSLIALIAATTVMTLMFKQ
jgi:uncharacterized membrane protein